jgi:hypothetical protein
VTAFFVPDGERFAATELTRGPWSAVHQHAGPPSALLARAVERALADDPAFQVARLTVELMAPVPIATLAVGTSVLRAGRKVRRIDATLAAGDRVIARATALAVRIESLELAPVTLDPREPLPPPEAGEPHRLAVATGQVGYLTAVETRRVRGGFGVNPTAVWFRPSVELIEGEPLSPLQRVMIVADSGNGVAVVLDPRRFTFVNADLTVYVHRLPEGEWVCLEAVTAPEPTGIGLTTTRLFDRRGPIGWGLQALVVQPRETGGAAAT